MSVAEAARIMREATKASDHVYAYAIQAGGTGGPVKIGLAKRPATRLRTLQTGNHETLVGLAAWRVLQLEEKDIHREYAHAHLRGEWFKPTADLIEFVLTAGGDFDDWDRQS